MNVSNNTTSSKENLALRTKASNEQHLSSSSSSEEEQRLLPLLDTLDSDSADKSNVGSRDDDVRARMEYMKQSNQLNFLFYMAPRSFNTVYGSSSHSSSVNRNTRIDKWSNEYRLE
ncbi:hypothetical protein L3Y34_013721 [Caenorhabditis briggsae]|uniref:Uncharacterized protein n=1 Tax=Caenorhabditis briggsae TaxID=6238 RepID=A0AAE9A2B2_CAEBR|nr:hypothetical protein L3Y34_013721 [Caenorhabditis briggsae]